MATTTRQANQYNLLDPTKPAEQLPLQEPNNQQPVRLTQAAMSGGANNQTQSQTQGTSNGYTPLQQKTTQATLDWLNNPTQGYNPQSYKQGRMDKAQSDWANTYEAQRQKYGRQSGSGLLQDQMLQNALAHNVEMGDFESNIDKENYDRQLDALARSLSTAQGVSASNENIFANRLNAIMNAQKAGAANVGDITNFMKSGGMDVSAVDPRAAASQKYEDDLHYFGLTNPQYLDAQGNVTEAGRKIFNQAQNKALDIDTSVSGIISDVANNPANYIKANNPQAYEQLRATATPYQPQGSVQGKGVFSAGTYKFSNPPTKNTALNINGNVYVVNGDLATERRGYGQPDMEYVPAINMETGETKKIYVAPQLMNVTY